MTAPLYLVDASIYIFRAYFSIPSGFEAKNGESVNAVYGYTRFLLDLIKLQPTHISCAFDESLVSCYRNDIYPEYKANRELPDENLSFQLRQCQRVTTLLGLHNLSLENYEADDIIGTLQSRFARDRPVVIVTRDKDLGQLLREGDQLWDFAGDVRSSPHDIEEKFGVRVDQMADFLALAGDSVDNIPGAPGIGAKTAAALLGQFGSLEALLEDTDAVSNSGMRGASRLAETLKEHASMLRTFRQITQINCDVPMDVALRDLEPAAIIDADITAFCDEMNFGKGLRKQMLEACRGAA